MTPELQTFLLAGWILVVFFLVSFVTGRKAPKRDDSWNAGYAAGVHHANSVMSKLPERVRHLRPISLHDVEVHVRQIRKEIEEKSP